MVFVTLIFSLPNKWFARFEYVTSLMKIIGVVIFIIVAFALIFGAGPTGKVHNGDTWRDLPVFKNGFKVCATSYTIN